VGGSNQRRLSLCVTGKKNDRLGPRQAAQKAAEEAEAEMLQDIAEIDAELNGYQDDGFDDRMQRRSHGR
jgi:hypothetical protein